MSQGKTPAYGPASSFQLAGTLLGANALNPFHRNDSAQRGAMIANHLGQSLVINGSDERMIQTGYEREYGRYTFGVSMPCDGEILEIIPRYQRTIGEDSIEDNPQTIVIYESAEDHKIGMFSLTQHCSNHQYFGFRYEPGPALKKLRVGASIGKGEVFLRSPNITDEGGYKYGVQANVAFVTMPATSEDGILICEDFLPRLGFRTYEQRVVDWGTKRFALNMYGDENNYQPFPDIGQRIRADNVLMALRPYGPEELAVVEQSVYSTMEVDPDFDTTIYADGEGGVIRDIRINHDLNSWNHAERHMDKQAQKYDKSRRIFYQRIVDVWQKYNKRYHGNANITPEFHFLVREAESVVSEGRGQRVTKLYRQIQLDDYRVEFIIEYDNIPGIGNKLTDLHGGKGVVCQTAPREHMPVDADGNVADIAMDPNSTISRMNLGRLFEQHVNAASRDVHKRLCAIAGWKLGDKDEEIALATVQEMPAGQFDSMLQHLLRYYQLTSPRMYAWFTEGKIASSEAHQKYLAQILCRGVGLWMPTDNPVESEDLVAGIEAEYKPLFGPVSYVGNSGRRVMTKVPVRVAPVYIVLLEKVGDDWSAVPSGKLQHFGVLSQLTKVDKYAKPARQQAGRVGGEAEVRIFNNYLEQSFTAELFDRNNNPQTHKLYVNNLLKAPQVSNIANLVDRASNPFGGSKPMQLIAHLGECGGWRFEHTPFQPHQRYAVPNTVYAAN